MLPEVAEKEFAEQRLQDVTEALARGMYVQARRQLHNLLSLGCSTPTRILTT